jgi:hypothetical protein
MLNIRRLSLLALVALAATAVRAQDDLDDITDIPDFNIPNFGNLLPSEQCAAVMNKHNISRCLTFIAASEDEKSIAEATSELDRLCSKGDFCTIDEVNDAIDDYEKDCRSDIENNSTLVVSQYLSWFGIPQLNAIQCLKDGDKYCIFEEVSENSTECTECEKKSLQAVLKVKFNRKPIIDLTSDEENNEEKAKTCGLDIEELVKEAEEENNSATGFYANILGTSLIALSAIVLSQ